MIEYHRMEDPLWRELEALEQEKGRLIQRYLELQDQADELNGRIYRLCCDIEVVNLRIRATRERLHPAGVPPPPADPGRTESRP